MPDLPTLTADEAQQPPVCPDCGQEIDDTVCWCGTLRTDHGGFGENHSFVSMGCNCHRAMPDPTNDLRSHALHQKSKEPPDVPRITAEEAAVLRLHSIPFNHYYAMRHAENRDLLDLRSGSLTPLGRAALAAFDAERVREIRRQAIEECLSSLRRSMIECDQDADKGMMFGVDFGIRRIHSEVQP